ncbi:helix-turn-helix domain-containing protein [Nocardia transvalensis]|uniref:helix-turn-helix domain-containing protein n=1 Tax=Nocardia transvalensis TaxID=37333 RepID=UPI0018938CD3|nr:helix-turn-helix domain-containing protein [Nocardia transvalensis]MBF6327664.1 AraC family transcriptional regulator [Nocardia transvalensis]
MNDERLLELRGALQVSARQVVHCPPHLLDGSAIRCFGFDVDEPEPVRRRKIPGGTIKIVFALDGIFDGVRRDPSALVVGMHDRGTTATHSGRMRSVQVQLDPLTARRLLGVPLHELRNTALPLDQFLGRSARDLAERLAETPRWEARFGLVAEYLRRQAPLGEADSAVTEAVARLRDHRGALPVSRLVAESGWSRRHFSRRFADHVGLPARTYASLLRFSATLTAMARSPAGPRDLGRMADRLGYYDQSHLIRDFRRFAGTSPSTLLREAMAQSSNTTGR